MLLWLPIVAVQPLLCRPLSAKRKKPARQTAPSAIPSLAMASTGMAASMVQPLSSRLAALFQGGLKPW